MCTFGGRGIIAGAHLRRFYPEDMGEWPVSMPDLDRYFTMAELVRHVSPGDAESPAQTWIMGELDGFKPHPPPWGVDVRFKGRGFDSSAERLWGLLHDDLLRARTTGGQRRLAVATHSVATKLEVKQGRVTCILCHDLRSPNSPPTVLEGDTVVLAASPIESARLVLHSKLGGSGTELPTAGLYLAEHYLCRATIPVRFPTRGLSGKCVNVVIPPPPGGREQRFQIDIQGAVNLHDADRLSLRLSGFAAMDPNPENRIQLLDGDHEWGVPRVSTHIKDIKDSPDDAVRIGVMKAKMRDIASKLGTTLEDSQIILNESGLSNHEVGTLRMGRDDKSSVTDSTGKMHSIDNLFVADAAVFPSIGAANPMLTITALAYRLAEHLAKKSGLQPNPRASWSWYDRYRKSTDA